MIKRSLLFFFGGCFSFYCIAQGYDKNENIHVVTETIDTSAIYTTPVPRKLSTDSASALKSDPAFAYMQYIDSVLRNKKKPAENPGTETQIKRHSILDNEGLKTLYWLIAILAVVIIIWRMFIGSNAMFSTNKKLKPKKDTASTQEEEEIEASEDQINAAIMQKKYRLATRLLYLQAIEKLGEKQYFAISPQKTNYQYLQELASKDIREQFARLTLHYEYAWFGNFQLSELQFNAIQNEFSSFIKTI